MMNDEIILYILIGLLCFASILSFHLRLYLNGIITLFITLLVILLLFLMRWIDGKEY
jgi:hypothetical protein